ncbi:MAG TPA: hypothetical protein VK176_11005 [Phycisphaerales bacterium]|nr:hypothetical protein [Phycisphaerales bacterium]
MFTLLAASTEEQSAWWEPSWHAIATHAVHVIVLLVLIIAVKALEHAFPRKFYQLVDLLRHLPFRHPPEKWTAVHITDDGTGVGEHGKVRLSEDEIQMLYKDCVGLARPVDSTGRPLDLYSVEETIFVSRMGKYRVAYSDKMQGRKRMRLYGRYTTAGFVAGWWFDTKPDTLFRGTYFVSLDDDQRAGTGCWIGKTRSHRGQVRMFPWVWRKVTTPSTGDK